MSKQVAVFAVALLAVFLVFFFRKKEEKKETKPISAAEIRKPISLGESEQRKPKRKRVLRSRVGSTQAKL